MFFNFFRTDTSFVEEKFIAHYEKYLQPKVQLYEQKRKQALRQFYIRAVALIFVLILGTTLALWLPLKHLVDDNTANKLIYGIFIIVLGLGIWLYIPIKTFQMNILENIYPLIFNYFEGNFIYSPAVPYDLKTLSSYSIIPGYDKCKLENFVHGNYRDVQIELFESELFKQEIRKTQNDKSEIYTYSVFKGLFIMLSMNKTFHGKTVVLQDAGIIGNFFERKKIKLETVRLEDPLFEQKFEVYSSDQIEARYLLTTSFMDRLLKLSSIFNYQPIQCSFLNEKLLMTISTNKISFRQRSIFRKINFIAEANAIIKQLRLIFSIIDELKLNMKIGL